MSAGYKHWSPQRLVKTLDQVHFNLRSLSATPPAHRGKEWEDRRRKLRTRRKRIAAALIHASLKSALKGK